MATINSRGSGGAGRNGSRMRRDSARNLTQGAYEGLRADLLACRVTPGSKLKIQDLCERFSVSLGAIREALSRLTSEGLVISEPQRGFRAAPISAVIGASA